MHLGTWNKLLILKEQYKCELLVLKTGLGVMLLLLAVCIINIKDIKKLRRQLYKHKLEDVVVISLRGIYTATALHVRPKPGVFKVHNKKIYIPINKRGVY